MQKRTIEKVRELLEAGIDGKMPYDDVRARFEKIDVSKYGHRMPNWVPDFEDVHKLLFDALKMTVPNPEQILELGAGTGRITKLLVENFPCATITAVDNSANMLTAFQSFPEHMAKRIFPVEDDFFSDALELPANAFDAMLSVFAIHHGRSDADYQRLYNRTFEWLKPGGCFISFDHVAASNNQLSELAFREWAELLDNHFDDETVYEIIVSTIKEDSPRPIYKHLDWLADAGFSQLDVLWKKGVFGIYFAVKPKEMER